MTPQILIRGLSKRFADRTAIKNLSASIQGGQLTGLAGPDGAGKTSLMRMLAGLMAPSGGSLLVAGHDPAAEPQAVQRMAGYMPQRFGLYEDLSVDENLRLYAGLRGLGAREAEAAFPRLLHFTGLQPFAKRLAGRLSGGMKQKLGLACALMARPKVLLLDEPSVGVDPISRRELWAMVQEMAGEGMAVVWATAYLEEAERCDQVLLLKDGELAYGGPPGKLSARLRGRSYLVSGLAGDRRRFLTEALDLPTVRDGLIQGGSVRLVLAEGAGPEAIEPLAQSAQGRIAPTPPRFEDAFIDLLGGGPPGRSAIAERMVPVPATDQVMVECRQLTKRFGAFAATDRISFAVRQGEIFGLLGPNGAGKSTTFRMLCGLLRPSAGQAEVAGLSLRGAGSQAKLLLGYMAQKFSLYGSISVRQNLELFSGLYGLKGALRRRRMAEMIELFHLQAFLDQSPEQLPLGHKQRMALACALMHRPKVLFLDEPTSGVDPITRREFWIHITGLVGKGVTVLVTTHFMDEAECCDRVALVNRARLIALDSPDALKARVARPDRPQPSMEDAFVELVLAQRQGDAAGTRLEDAA